MSSMFFPSAAWMYYFAQYLNYQQIASVMGVGVIVSLIAEIPTGVFADMVGRKWSVFLSSLIYTLAMIGTVLARSYEAFLIVTIMNALVNALYSGSAEALLYDTLKQAKREKEFEVWTSRTDAVAWIALFVSSIAGGYLYAINPKYPYIAQAIFVACASIVTLFITEPKLDTVKYQLSDIWKNNLKGFKELFVSSTLRYWTAIFVTIGVGYYIAADILGISQQRQYGLHPQYVGWVLGIGFIISAMMSHYYPQLRKLFGEKKLIVMSGMILILSFLGAKYVGLGLGVTLIMMRVSSSTTFRNSRSVVINREIESKNRATTLSTLNLLTMFPYGLSAAWIGLYIDRTSPNQFAFVLGVGILVLLCITQVLHSARIFAKLRG